MNCCKINFKLEEECLNFTLENSTLEFKADLGYISGNVNSYAPLSEKPQINYRILQPGNNTYEYLGVQETIYDITEQDIDRIIYGG